MDEKAKILDIAMNLNRLGGWAVDGYWAKQKRIKLFLEQNRELINTIKVSLLPKRFQKTLNRFLQEYPSLEKAGKAGPKDKLFWAEQMMTWGNILTHRSQLISS